MGGRECAPPPPSPRLVFVLFAAISISCYGLSEAGVGGDTATDLPVMELRAVQSRMNCILYAL